MPPSSPAGRAPGAPLSKRSATVSLVLLVGAGAAALALGHLDESQREEDALVYDTEGACIAQGLRPAGECAAEYRAALDRYAADAPRYPTDAACERHHGPGGCTRLADGSPGDGSAFVPLMAGYMIGRTAAQGLPAQPLYRHAPEEQQAAAGSGGGSGGYCTSSGGRVYAARGGSVTRVSSAVARTTASAGTPHAVARGGFGGTGRAFSSGGGRSGGSGGG
ncbi:DUF1190 domain-containing protein [Methylobacterium sp. NEAU 140]|uniref:DUF1190 domain-containing protein n=1 Tax=Methylobacterium sp. NEAU 140 TaxID=3064945 RepID=UPI0027370EFD|nr:DUF1190 domain-containing protein [Methylobacterium sp. NEAU 140]MDP4022870.1 DUF1190 domain-containing protein [Methylobacterium sp. NEAU 140]